MKRDRTRWHDSSNPTTVARGFTWRAMVWVGAVLAFFAVVGGVIWGVKVATSEVKGRGDATRITNDGRNQINSQEWFAGQHGQILAADQKLDQAKAELDAAIGKPAESFARTNYTGLVNRCLDMVNAYNAETKKISRGKWLTPDLPYEINLNDPTTDCKEKTVR